MSRKRKTGQKTLDELFNLAKKAVSHSESSSDTKTVPPQEDDDQIIIDQGTRVYNKDLYTPLVVYWYICMLVLALTIQSFTWPWYHSIAGYATVMEFMHKGGVA